MARLHQDSFTKFRNLLERYDPDRKFENDFTRRLLGRER
jgi:hypothetical protein